jgi:hypothetical protein
LEEYVFRTVFEPRTLLLGFSALVVQTAASEAKPLRARTHLVETALDERNVPVLWMYMVTHPEERNKKDTFLQTLARTWVFL